MRAPLAQGDWSTIGPTDPRTIDREIARLETLDLPALRVHFRNRTGRIAPARISRPLLFRVLAYRIQAERFGDLRPDVRRLLDRLGTEEAAGAALNDGSKAISAPAPASERPRRGTVLVREWQGRMEHVMVLDDGFAWNGTTYASLSAAAQAITGTKWNGRRFFGLDRRESGAAASGAGGGVGRTGMTRREQNRHEQDSRRLPVGGSTLPPGRNNPRPRPGSSALAGAAP